MNMFTYVLGNSLFKLVSRLMRYVFKIGDADNSAVITDINTDVSVKAEWLMNTFGNQILRYAYSFMKNMEDAEDILQETIIMYLRKAPSFESSEHAKAWLLTVTGNNAKNKLKYNSYRQHDELNEELVGRKEEDLSFLWEAVKSLPVDQREVIHLFYEEDYTTSQIADILKKKESTVRSLLKRGRDKLKVILKEEYDFGE